MISLERINPIGIMEAVRDGKVSIDLAVRICGDRKRGKIIAYDAIDSFMKGTKSVEECVALLCSAGIAPEQYDDTIAYLKSKGCRTWLAKKDTRRHWLITWTGVP